MTGIEATLAAVESLSLGDDFVYIDIAANCGLPPSKPMIRNFASQIAQKDVGKNWADRFVRRHQIDLILHWASGLDRNRFKADSAFKYTIYFELLKRKIEQYNVDEKGFLISVLSKMKRVFSRSAFEEGKLRHIIQDGNRLAWLKQVFDRETKKKARTSWRLLILDGHGSHVSMEFIEYCDANKILLMIYPPHSTHTLQPLDVVMFAPLAAANKAELARFLDRAQGLTSITKRDFYRLFNAAWHSSFNEKLIQKSFEATGISPLDPGVILKRFTTVQADTSRPNSSGSSSSVLSASDWRKIERLLRQAGDDIYDENSKKLSQTIHTISAKNQLLQHENNSLREALSNEKRRRQRGKALLLEPPADYDGGAVFWSPNKVAEARDRPEQKDLQE
ncbi:pogo transposable element [Stemphylium lycopersici]|uniref:Pogo transposable element n=1 Tax=Stemphylium lycopersici TaxID=183478 RepID=A0A364MRC2_STELY|nr:pogo transposable element [Stemphylium lycopersici]